MASVIRAFFSLRADAPLGQIRFPESPRDAELRNFLPHEVNSGPYRVTGRLASNGTNILARCHWAKALKATDGH